MDFGLVRYDPKSRSFPKSVPSRIESDLSEELIKTEEQDDVNLGVMHETASNHEAQGQRTGGSNREGTQTHQGSRPSEGRMESKVIGDRIMKRTRKGARRGIDRRAGRGR